MMQPLVLARLATAIIFFVAAIYGAVHEHFLIAFPASLFLGLLIYNLMTVSIQHTRLLPPITATGSLCIRFNGSAYPEWLETGSNRYNLAGIAPEHLQESLIEGENIIYKGVRYQPVRQQGIR